MNKLKLFLFLFSTLSTQFTFGQGCSDAGFCTIDSFKPNDSNSSSVHTHNQAKVGAFLGKAERSIMAYGSYIEYSRQINNNLSLDFKLTSLGFNGNNITTFGVSDIFAIANYRTKTKLSLTLGLKAPLNNGNAKRDNLPLPMDYQTSLGTFDLIFGVGYHINKLQLNVALQQPLTQNDNTFLNSDYPQNSYLHSFQSTNNFKRNGDLLLRISYPLQLSSKTRLTPSLLPIYHLANDKYTNENNMKVVIKGSEGLTLNGNIYLDYLLNNKNSIQLNIGAPFMYRDTRPDGLTRKFIANLEYRVRF